MKMKMNEWVYFMRRVWNLLRQKSEEKVVAAERHPAPESKAAAMTVCLEECLAEMYEFRFNRLTDGNEFREKTKREKGVYEPLTLRALNSICMKLHKRGVNCWDRDLARYVNSLAIPAYHPFVDYLEGLPAWDGKDRLTDLAERISTNPLWVNCFRLWMRGMVNQWRGGQNDYANSIAPILISSEQGKGKSTFCKSLIPGELQHYYIDRIEMTSQGQLERKLSEFALINLDEFDKFTLRQMALLKNVMQMTTLHYRLPNQKNFITQPRMASFIGTTNRKDLLTDPTGSRRFICVEVKGQIDCSGIDHQEIYAQLAAELRQGCRHWLNATEEKELQAHNQVFYRHSPVLDVLLRYYRPALGEEECQLLSSAEIFKILKKKNGAAMQGANPNNLGYLLVSAGMERRHTRRGNMYRVVSVA